MNFKKIFDELCTDKDVDMQEVAEATGIYLPTLYKLRETNNYPSFKIAVDLCNYFECFIDYFLGLGSRFEQCTKYTTDKFIQNYEKLLNEHKTSHFKISESLKIGRNRIYDWKKGHLPYLSTLITIANYFNITVEDLIC